MKNQTVENIKNSAFAIGLTLFYVGLLALLRVILHAYGMRLPFSPWWGLLAGIPNFLLVIGMAQAATMERERIIR